MTPSGIEPATFQFVAQRLNHCATAVPNFHIVNEYLNMNILACWTTAIFGSSVAITATVRLEDGGNVRFLAGGSYLYSLQGVQIGSLVHLPLCLMGSEVKAARL